MKCPGSHIASPALWPLSEGAARVLCQVRGNFFIKESKFILEAKGASLKLLRIPAGHAQCPVPSAQERGAGLRLPPGTGFVPLEAEVPRRAEFGYAVRWKSGFPFSPSPNLTPLPHAETELSLLTLISLQDSGKPPNWLNPVGFTRPRLVLEGGWWSWRGLESGRVSFSNTLWKTLGPFGL